MPPSDLKALIRAIIREELRDLEQQRSTAVSTPPAPFDLRNLVKQELAAMTTPTAPVAPPARPLPTYADVASLTTPTASVAQTLMPTYADIAAIPPAAVTSGPADITCGHLASVREEIQQVLRKGPKFSVEPTLRPEEKIATAKTVSKLAKEEERYS
ncbi:hypothetical protein HPB52_002464 [Rhipicephalus sanguineus]|uniref:Uncharacterized protein n=1 Tax=Rhipicephalus sanguineus TaxID=34632 RepID=A0A9D4PY87_RHISA|nr:hypothetical protein HPB52_002464 [Rhipicephalus sanguineus]